MKRSLTFILMLGGGMLGALSGCEKEKSPLLKQKTEVDIFSQVGSNPLIQQITRSLQQQGDTGAYRKTFVQEYGVPLWMKAKCLEQGGNLYGDCSAAGVWAELPAGVVDFYHKGW